ncbi:hypothetical protein QJS10_CPA06g00858 [Acorus calamus]|uniref:Uncharacterized protein n=1 Tax=Acorus calamus TaxID=4465 RepID=A0AAV9ENY3_ACOCL|nr:hypothetical protein QJS10_CPA06g00858 [Acorus calamus]
MAMKVAFENLSDSRYKMRDTSIGGLGGFEKVELSVMLCNDDFIQKLNKEWRDEDRGRMCCRCLNTFLSLIFPFAGYPPNKLKTSKKVEEIEISSNKKQHTRYPEDYCPPQCLFYHKIPIPMQ